MVMNSCLKRLTSTGRKGDLGAVQETEEDTPCVSACMQQQDARGDSHCTRRTSPLTRANAKELSLLSADEGPAPSSDVAGDDDRDRFCIVTEIYEWEWGRGLDYKSEGGQVRPFIQQRHARATRKK
jgi:hypothetical protein